MSVWDKIDFDEFTGEETPVDPKVEKLLKKTHPQLVRDYNNKWTSKLGGKIQGPIQGAKNVESGLLQSICLDGGNTFKEKYVGTQKHKEWSANGGHSQVENEYTCPKCGKIGKSNSMFKHHFDNCGKNPILEIVNDVIVAEWQCLQDIVDEYGGSIGILSQASNGKRPTGHPHRAYKKYWYKKNNYNNSSVSLLRERVGGKKV